MPTFSICLKLPTKYIPVSQLNEELLDSISRLPKETKIIFCILETKSCKMLRQLLLNKLLSKLFGKIHSYY